MLNWSKTVTNLKLIIPSQRCFRVTKPRPGLGVWYHKKAYLFFLDAVNNVEDLVDVRMSAGKVAEDRMFGVLVGHAKAGHDAILGLLEQRHHWPLGCWWPLALLSRLGPKRKCKQTNWLIHAKMQKLRRVVKFGGKTRKFSFLQIVLKRFLEWVAPSKSSKLLKCKRTSWLYSRCKHTP